MKSKIENEITPAQPEKKSCPLAVAIILAILAVGGIGFGIFELFNKKPETVIADSNCSDCKAQKETESETLEGQSTNTFHETPSEDHYIYLADDWNIKIKLPKEIYGTEKLPRTLGYAFNGNLYLWGTIHKQGEQAASPGIMDEDLGNDKIRTPYLAKVFVSYGISCTQQNSVFIKKVSENEELCYKESENLKNTYSDEQMKSHIELTLESIQEIFTNPDNYSFIEN